MGSISAYTTQEPLERLMSYSLVLVATKLKGETEQHKAFMA
jgi:hypothetical protein